MSFYADSNNNSSSNNGGGFFSPGGTTTADGGYAGTPDAFGSQQKKNKSKYNDKLVPVTISQILKSENDMNEEGLFRFESTQEFAQVKFVGFVTSVKDTSTHVIFTIADGTGTIEVQFWMDTSEDGDSGSSIASTVRTACTEGSYVRVIGAIKVFNDRKQIQAFNILPVTNFNEITHHALEATYVHLKVTKGTSGASNSGSDDVSTKTYEGTSSGATDDNTLQNVVLQVFREHSAQGESGLDIKRAVEMLVSKGHVASEVRKAIGFLADEGHLYTTIDEDHLKCT